MKKFIKKLTTIFIVCALLCGVCGMVAFASSSSDDEPQVDRNPHSYSWTNSSASGEIKYPGAYGQGSDNATSDGYVLAVSSGTLSTGDPEVSAVIIQYYTSSENEKKDLPTTQILTPNRISSSATHSSKDGIYTALGSNWPFYGSSQSLFYPVVNVDGSQYYIGQNAITRHFGWYTQWANSIISDVNIERFPQASDKIKDTFEPGNTQFMRFRFEYTPYSIKSVSFVLSTKSISAEWAMNGWMLIKENYNANDIKANNYAFLSDSLGYEFKGTVVASSTEISNKKTVEGVSCVPDAVFTYYNKNMVKAAGVPLTNDENINYGDNEAKNVTYDRWATMIEPSFLSSLFFDTPSYEKKVDYTVGFYNVVINIADVYGAGVETFNSSVVWDLLATGAIVTEGEELLENDVKTYTTPYAAFKAKFAGTQLTDDDIANDPLILFDMLRAKIRYQNTDGEYKVLEVPVFSNALLEYFVPVTEFQNFKDFEASDEYKKRWNGEYRSFAQQGESICFTVAIPNLKAFTDVELSYFNPIDGDDVLAVESIGIYDNWGQKDYPRRDLYTKESDYAISAKVEKITKGGVTYTPTLLYGTTYNDITWLDGFSEDVPFELDDLSTIAAARRSLPKVISYDDTYLVLLTTDMEAQASSHADLSVQLDYLNWEDEEVSTDYKSLRYVSQDYMGTNYGLLKTTTLNIADMSETVRYSIPDCGYEWGLQNGNTIGFTVKITDLQKFTKIRLRYDTDDFNDDYQCLGIRIVKVTDIGKRKITALNDSVYSMNDEIDSFDLVFNRGYSRTFTGTDVYNNDKACLYVSQVQRENELTLKTGSKTAEYETRPDVSDQLYSMDYATVTSDLKFTTPVQTYQVNVHVANNSVNATGTDNCGSSNMFYFQLVFRKGTSAYVLANKQLASDSFLSGDIATFTIATNEDMGDLVSVRIIPDDITSSANPDDKLNIDMLEVIRIGRNTPNKRYVAEAVGWISPVYRDTIDATDKVTRTESDIAINVPISYSAYCLDLEFSIATGEYSDNSPQFEGDMTMDLKYIDSKGKEVTKRDISIVKLMFDYMNQTPRISPTTNRYVSEPKYMFRENTVDRFVIPIEDCQKITAVSLHGFPLENTALPITDLSIRALTGEGTGRWKNGEFIMEYDDDETPVIVSTLQTKPSSAHVFMPTTDQPWTFRLKSSEFPEFDEGTLIDSIVSRVPDSQNDVVNVYLFLADGTPTPNDAGYDLLTRISYSSTVDQKDHELHLTDYMQKNINGQNVIYVEGQGAKNLSVINHISMYSSAYDQKYQVEQAVIQQIREGVMVNSWNITFTAHNFTAMNGISTNQISSTASNRSDKQVVNLILAPGTVPSELIAEEKDIAVAIEYKTKAIGSKTYVSPYVYATDTGVDEIHAGSSLSFTFREFDVSQITAIRVVCVGELIAYVDSSNQFSGINAMTYVGEVREEPEMMYWYSSACKKTKLDMAIKSFPITCTEDLTEGEPQKIDTLKRVNITFKTAESGNVDSAGNLPIRAKILYNQKSGLARAQIADIREYISDPYGTKFVPGSEVTISLMLPGLVSMVSMEVEPYDEDMNNIGKWNLEYVYFDAEGVECEVSPKIMVNQAIEEDNPVTINMSLIKLNYSVYTVRLAQADDEEDKITKLTVANDMVDIKLESGTMIRLAPKLTGSEAGYRLYVYKMENGVPIHIQNNDMFTNDPAIDFTVDNATSEDVTYRFVLESADNPGAKGQVDVTVMPVKGSSVPQ